MVYRSFDPKSFRPRKMNMWVQCLKRHTGPPPLPPFQNWTLPPMGIDFVDVSDDLEKKIILWFKTIFGLRKNKVYKSLETAPHGQKRQETGPQGQETSRNCSAGLEMSRNCPAGLGRQVSRTCGRQRVRFALKKKLISWFFFQGRTFFSFIIADRALIFGPRR